MKDRNGSFIEGKFDKSARPDTVLAEALNTFFGNIIEADSRNVHLSMRWRIHDAIGSGNNPLLKAIPNLQKFMPEGYTGNKGEVKSVGGMGSSYRLKFMFCKLIGAIACRTQPLVLFLDDLQWADEMTRKLS